MSGDVLLDQFQLPKPAPDIYRIGQYAPVSIRDQVVRAMYLVDRLFVTGSLAASTQLVIVGAGVAGVTMALHAAARGVARILLYDQGAGVLALQAASTSRWLCPTQYDWPASHWDTAQWPVPEPAPRFFTSVTLAPPVHLAAKLASRWASQFQNLLRPRQRSKQVVLQPNTKVSGWTPRPLGGYDVDLVDSRTNAPLAAVGADLIVFAGGFGGERVDVADTNPKFADFQGLPFWSTDKFERPSFGMPSVSHGVLVSGSGDGALQDFARLVTGRKSARDVWDTVTSGVQHDWWVAELNAVWHWEDHARRSAQFAPQHLSICELQRRLHGRYAAVIQELTASPTDWNGVLSRLDPFVNGSGRPLDKVWLAVKGDHFDSCYPLNRVVVLVLLEYIRARKASHEALLANTAVKTTSSAHAASCANGCWGNAHDVVLAQGVACDTTAKQIKSWTNTRTERYDGLVIRHGIEPAVVAGAAQMLTVQNLPFHLP